MKLFKIFISYLTIFVTVIPSVNGQGYDVLKKIIIDDVILTNKIYCEQILQRNQRYVIIDDYDTSNIENIIPDIISNEYNFKIISIDSLLGFYIIKAKISLISKTYSLFDSTLNYVLYRSGDRYYKINGFLTSELLIIPYFKHSKFTLEKIGIKYNKKILKYIRQRNAKKLREYLVVSLLYRQNIIGRFPVDYYPLVISKLY